jgi:hypothetical protein
VLKVKHDVGSLLPDIPRSRLMLCGRDIQLPILVLVLEYHPDMLLSDPIVIN